MNCCFIGHRDAKGIENIIERNINLLLKSGITDFYSGGSGNFDTLCEKAVKNLGGKINFVPYNISQIHSSSNIIFDKIILPFGNKPYSKYDIPNRNKWLVDHCDVMLCYVYKNGGAKKTLDYAEKSNKKILNIDDELQIIY